ncbi:MAG: hypothetical protein AAF927_01380 [Bacteroidota bacterium]
MYKTKLLQILNHLSPKEKKQFQEFVASPYFNQREEAKVMLSHLLSLPPEDPGLHRRSVYRVVYGKAQLNETRLRLETSHLYKLLKRFLAQKAYEKDDSASELYLLTSLREHKLTKVFEIEQKRFDSKLAQSATQDGDYHYAQFKKEAEANAMYGQQYLRLPDPHLQAKIDHLDRYYLLLKLKESCEMRNRERILNTPYELHLLAEIRAFLQQNQAWLAEDPALAIYSLILQLQDAELAKKPDLERLDQLLTLLAQHHQLVNQQEARGMYKHAQNYCIRCVNLGIAGFRERLLAIYQQGLENGLLLVTGTIAPTDYQNIVITALRLDKLAWAKSFAEEYQSKLVAEGRNNAYHMVLAHIYNAEGRNSDAIQLLQSVQFSDISFQLNARMLLFQLYYEQQAWEAALYHLEAFNIFVRRNKQIPTPRRKAYSNQLKLSRKLILLAEKTKKLGGEEFRKETESLHRQLQHTSQLVNRNWLVGKLQKLKDIYLKG